MDYLHQLAHWFVELLWPTRCAGCAVLGISLCRQCQGKMKPLSTQRCLVCRHPNSLGLPCPSCRNTTHIDRIFAATAMEAIAEKAIYALKYRGIQHLANTMGDWMATVVGLRSSNRMLFGTNPLIVPVPLHPARLRERGYNQAVLLARRVAMAAAMVIDDSSLVRVRHTESQVRTRSRIERRDNMRGAFAITHPETIVDRDIILVDDVCTTGATLEDCARALKEAGARSVSAIVLARG